jgi:hypothetical protein
MGAGMDATGAKLVAEADKEVPSAAAAAAASAGKKAAAAGGAGGKASGGAGMEDGDSEGDEEGEEGDEDGEGADEEDVDSRGRRAGKLYKSAIPPAAMEAAFQRATVAFAAKRVTDPTSPDFKPTWARAAAAAAEDTAAGAAGGAGGSRASPAATSAALLPGASSAPPVATLTAYIQRAKAGSALEEAPVVEAVGGAHADTTPAAAITTRYVDVLRQEAYSTVEGLAAQHALVVGKKRSREGASERRGGWGGGGREMAAWRGVVPVDATCVRNPTTVQRSAAARAAWTQGGPTPSA